MTRIPSVNFVFREFGEFVTRSTDELFSGKRVVIFSLPGAFTPTCSNKQLPTFDHLYDEFIGLGIDDVYCISVNDGFVMNAWQQNLNVARVKLIPDGNAEFTTGMGMLIAKNNLGFGNRSWRYAAVIDDGNIEWMVEEPGRCDNAEDDPYGETTPEVVLDYVKLTVRETAQV